MTVKVRERKYDNGKMHFEADIHVRLVDGTMHRERRRAPGGSLQAATRWAKEREAWLIRHGPEAALEVERGGAARGPRRGARREEEREEVREAPTLAEFAERYLVEHVRANRLRPATVADKENRLSCHLLPTLGDRRLDAISDADVQRLKVSRRELSATTLNQVLGLLRAMLALAVKWKVIEAMPCSIERVREPPKRTAFYTPEEFERLVATARALGPNEYVMVLLGGDAGLRAGEMIGIRWGDVDLRQARLTIVENEWRGHVGGPKGGHERHVVLTSRLVDALAELPKGDARSRVLRRKVGGEESATKGSIDSWLGRVQRKAGFPEKGPHILRHTFCSRLALLGAPARAIQGLAGHASSKTTERYMHLAPQVLESAIRLLDGPPARRSRGTGAGTERFQEVGKS